MAVRTLLQRAQELARRPAVPAALVIVPLALAASTQVSAATFSVTSASVPQISGGSALGTAAWTYPGSTDPGSGAQAQLFGTTAGGAAAGNSYVTANQAAAASSALTFQWQGTLAGSAQAGDQIGLSYDFLISVLAADPGRAPTDTSPGVPFADPVSWELTFDSFDGNGDPIFTYDSNIQNASFDIPVADLNTPLSQSFQGSTGVPLLQNATDCTWYVTLQVNWAPANGGSPYYYTLYPADLLSVSIPQHQSIDLSYPSTVSGNTLVPLPAAVWSGPPLLAMAMFATRRIGRRARRC